MHGIGIAHLILSSILVGHWFDTFATSSSGGPCHRRVCCNNHGIIVKECLGLLIFVQDDLPNVYVP